MGRDHRSGREELVIQRVREQVGGFQNVATCRYILGF
jgi:hypothetical protein